jgi:hypothetical protein
MTVAMQLQFRELTSDVLKRPVVWIIEVHSLQLQFSRDPSMSLNRC